MKMWICNKCKRKFAKINQSHSCVIYPLKNHFKNKEKAKELFNDLIKKLKQNLKFRIDSVHCCIRLVKINTFLGIFPLKDKIRVTFALSYKLKSSKIRKYLQMSKNRYLYEIEINDKKDIDKELLSWIKESYKK